MTDNLQQRIDDALKNPQNMGEMAGADSIGTVGNADCGDMLRVWVKFKDENGRKVIDKASFQSFGCETAIAAASLAMELIRGKTPEEAMKMRGEEFAKDLGPLPPTTLSARCTVALEVCSRPFVSRVPVRSNSPVAASIRPRLPSASLKRTHSNGSNSSPMRKSIVCRSVQTCSGGTIQVNS